MKSNNAYNIILVFTQNGLILNILINKNTAHATELASWADQKNVLSTELDLNSLSKL
jgi:hypothetical protein